MKSNPSAAVSNATKNKTVIMNKRTKYTLIALLLVGIVTACGSGKENKVQDGLMVVQGVLEKQGITSYQYGSYTLESDDGFYALSSAEVDLEPYVGKEVEIRATKIEGYPVDGGPVYLQVNQVKEL